MPRISIFSGASSRCLRLWLVLFAICLSIFTTGSTGYAQSRLRERIQEAPDNAHFSIVAGNVHPSARPQFEVGALAPDVRLGRVTLFFSRTPQQEAELETLLSELQDRSSANYHRWLSPEEFADRFGLSQLDVDKIVGWLQSQGLAIEALSRSRTWVAFSGTAQQVDAALRTDLRRYAIGGETHFAISREPSVPSAFADVVLGFRGLNDFPLKPRAKKVESHFTSEISGNHFLAPGDIATIYNLAPLYPGVDGTGQKIAIAGKTAINVSDIQAFRTASGLAPNVPQITLVPQSVTQDSDPGMVAGDIDEANLDVEWAGAVARNATILYVYSKDVLDAFTYIIDLSLAPVLSISYGLCEGGSSGFTSSDAKTLASIAQQGNAKGITIVAPTGDAGAADCDNDVSTANQGLSVDLPGALPYVTAIGGTRFSGDASSPASFWGSSTSNPNTALTYIPETGWNDTTSSGLSATGGGSSSYFPKPSWQTGTGVPKDGARDVPDIAFSASGNHDGYLACSRDVSADAPTCVNGFRKANGDLTVFGGTSVGVPVFAGVVALLNQVSNQPAGQGNINPRLYALAASSPSSFHDVTTGDNKVPFKASNLAECTPVSTTQIGYTAGAGYDLVTGLGSINGQNFVTNWTSAAPPAVGPSISPDFSLSVSPQTLTVKRGACGSTQVTVSRTSNFAGTPSFTCSAAAPLTAVTCSVSPLATSMLTPQRFPANRWWPLAVALALLLLLLSASYSRSRRRPQSQALAWLRWAPVFASVCLLALIIGCKSSSNNSGSGSPSAPASNFVFTVDAPASASVGSAAVTVTGTIGGVSRTTQMTLSVN